MTSGTAAPHGCRGMEPCPACNSAGCTRPLPNAPATMDAEFERLVEDVAGLVYPPFRGWHEWERMRQERIAALWSYVQRREAHVRIEGERQKRRADIAEVALAEAGKRFAAGDYEGVRLLLCDSHAREHAATLPVPAAPETEATTNPAGISSSLVDAPEREADDDG